MYKVIIADDEKIIQEGLARKIKGLDLGFEVVGTFSDGEDVIEYLESMPVDVILTDIMMTHISGIDVARYVYESEIPCKVVFISGHKEFDLAFQAIKYGVEDYILKPSRAEELRAVLLKIRKELDGKALDNEFLLRTEKRWAEMYPILEEKFLSSLVMGALEDKEDIKQRMQMLYPEIDAEHCPCMLMNLEIRDYDTFMHDVWNYSMEQFDDAVYNFVAMYQGIASFHVIYKYKGSIRLFGIMKDYRASKEENEELCRTQAEQFCGQFKDIFGADISIEINRIFDHVYQIADYREDVFGENYRHEDAYLLLQEQKKLILTNIMQGNISTAQKMLNNILNNLSSEDIRYCRNVMIDIFSSINELLRGNNQQLYKMLQPFMDYHNIFNVRSMAELERYCKRVFDKMKSRESMSDQFNKDAFVNRIKEYVQGHIGEDVLLENVANEMFLSTSHLRRIFKKQTGETFLQYATRMKIEKAAELLRDPQYKVYQVSEALGYKTARYFSKVFYSSTGYYPAQYRKEVLKMGDVSDEEE